MTAGSCVLVTERKEISYEMVESRVRGNDWVAAKMNKAKEIDTKWNNPIQNNISAA